MEPGDVHKHVLDSTGVQSAPVQNDSPTHHSDNTYGSRLNVSEVFNNSQGENKFSKTNNEQSGANSVSGFSQVQGESVNTEISLGPPYSSQQNSKDGPSNDREDISDDEFDIEKTSATEDRSESHGVRQQAANGTSYDNLGIRTFDSFSHESGKSSSQSGNMSFSNNQVHNDGAYNNEREVVDNKPRNLPTEDLEAVSDDEFVPDVTNATTAADNSNLRKPALIAGGEEVSSSEDEGPASPDSAYNAAHEIDLSGEAVGWNPSETSLCSGEGGASIGNNAASSQDISTIMPPSTGLASLEAEPISDEDSEHEDGSCSDPEAAEAGEVKSPPPPTQPVKELLREAEPISADESSDTDGELPSGDEKGKNDNFESIDSDEGDIGLNVNVQRTLSHSSSHEPSSIRKNNGSTAEQLKDLEAVSDDDNCVSVENDKKCVKNEKTNPEKNIPNSTEFEKRPVTNNFNEHHEELDYEENEGDDTETKIEEGKDGQEEGEEGEVNSDAEAANDDKDEGECSDDDCEEGEIKEPGTRKPFIKPICRFFQRGNCTWGISCRFLHPGINDKGNYQMIEIPGFQPQGVQPPMGGQWQEPEDEPELPPPPIPDIPHVETAWERGLRIAKEQRKKASERKINEPDFEEKRLNLSIDEDKETNKENERVPKPKQIIVKDPYYDKQAYEEDEYYNLSANNPWQTGQYENFEVRYNRDNSFSPPYREKPMGPPPSRFIPSQYNNDKFGRQREEQRRPPFRPDPPPANANDYPSPVKRPDEWTDPWRRSKSPTTAPKKKHRSRSRGRRNKRSVSDSSNSSRSSSSSGSSRSSRSGSSSGSSSRSRSPEPAPPGVDRHDRYNHSSPGRYGDGPRSAVSFRGRGRGGRGYDNRGHRGRGNFFNNDRNYGGRGGYIDRGRGGYNRNNYGGPMNRDSRGGRGRNEDRFGRDRARSPPGRPLPYVRPRPKSASSHSSSSRSRSRSRSRSDSSRSRSRSRSSSNSSRSSSSSSSSAGSADSEHLYRDLGSPTKPARGSQSGPQKKKRTNSHKERPVPKVGAVPGSQESKKSKQLPSSGSSNLDRIPHPRESSKSDKPSAPSSLRQDSKYASRNAPQLPVKAKDPLKVVGQKSSITLTLLPKQQQSNLGSRTNPLDSPPHNKRRLSERDSSPVPLPPAKRPTMPLPSQASAMRIAAEKAAKIQLRHDKAKSPPPVSMPSSASSTSFSSTASQRAKAAVSPQKQANSSSKMRVAEPAVGKPAPKAPAPAPPTASATGAKAKKSMSSRREELLKQLKAVEDAIHRKKTKL